MIKEQNKFFYLETKNLSYIFHVNEFGYLLHDYFGNKIEVYDESSLGLKEAYPKGTSTNVGENFSPDNNLLEYSFTQKGDYKSPSIIMRNKSRGYTFDFRYLDYEIKNDITKLINLPNLHNLKEELVIRLKENELNIILELHYLINEDYDVIVRNSTLVNNEEETLIIEKIASLQLDLINDGYDLISLNGGWINETHKERTRISKGIHIIDSKTGNSSNKHNPFFMILNKDTKEDYGECFGFNLVYSGNHEELIELTTYDHLHIQNGINSHLFIWELNKEESFTTPYSILSYSKKGMNLLSNRFHDFINSCVINENFKDCPRPILINNWEGTYFKFNERKLLKIARSSKKHGVELFVMDDGWFSTRNTDTSGLGDYDVNRKKLPHGITGLCKKINKMGLNFGLWMEPEGVNPNSKIYNLHPDWVIKAKGVSPSLGRNELLFDLTNKEVREYIKTNISNILSSANISYVKWDMNRNMSDMPGVGYNHKYIMGLYEILEYLTSKFPKVLFENCASGGNRFDLGMLSYFPQTWASDCSDPYERISIQEGLSLGYPQSTYTCHVSHKHNHQLLRETPYRTKFDVAAFGVLGYELMMNELSYLEKKEIKNQIEFYKSHRTLLQFGDFYRLKEKDFEGDNASWLIKSKDNTEAILGYFNGLQKGNPSETVIKNIYLDPNKKYKIEVLKQDYDIKEFGNLINMILPIHVNSEGFLVRTISKFKSMDMEKEEYIVSGSQLNNGLILNSEWAGNGYSDKVRVLRDFGSRIYYIKEIN